MISHIYYTLSAIDPYAYNMRLRNTGALWTALFPWLVYYQQMLFVRFCLDFEM